MLSRGIFPSKTKDYKLWWNGPNKMQSEKIYQDEKIFELSKIKPLKVHQSINILTCTTIIKKNIFFEKFHDFVKLIRTTAGCTRFCLNAHNSGPFITEKYLNTYEFQQATYTLIEVVQLEHFEDEIKRLQNDKCIDSQSGLISLAPFLDSM